MPDEVLDSMDKLHGPQGTAGLCRTTETAPFAGASFRGSPAGSGCWDLLRSNFVNFAAYSWSAPKEFFDQGTFFLSLLDSGLIFWD